MNRNRSKSVLNQKKVNSPIPQLRKRTVAQPDPVVARVGNIQIGAEIGKGGFGTVFLGLSLETGASVAVKRISLHDIEKEELSGIQSEIDLLKRLNHENIVKYCDTVQQDNYLYIILEYMENGSLAQTLKRFGNLSESLVAIYIAQVLRGLAYLHEQGVLHRDIKGANILTSKDGVVKLADFGVAVRLGDAQKSNSVVGTPYWMAPEIIEMVGCTAASDIWSVGCTVIELLTGKPPYFDLAPMAALFRIVQDPYPPVPEGLSPACREFLMKCFSKHPPHRGTATELLEMPWITSAPRRNLNQQSKRLIETISTTEDSGISQVIARERTLRGLSPSWPAEEKENRRRSKKDSDLERSRTRTTSDANQGPRTPKSPRGPKLPSPTASPRYKEKMAKDKREEEEELWDTEETTDNSASVRHGPFAHLRLGQQDSPRSKPPDADALDDWEDDDDEGKSSTSEKKTAGTSSGTQSASSTLRLLSLDATPTARLQRFKEVESEDLEGLDLQVGENQKGKASQSAERLDLAQRLRQRMSQLSEAENTISWQDDFEEEDLEESADRDLIAKQSTMIATLLRQLETSSSDAAVLQACNELESALSESSVDQRAAIVRSQNGIIPLLMDVLDRKSPAVLLAVLRLMQLLTEENKKLQENLSLVGFIPIVIRIVSSSRPKADDAVLGGRSPSSGQQGRERSGEKESIEDEDPKLQIRMEAAKLIHKICRTSTLTLQMLIACGGLAVLVNFLDISDARYQPLVKIGLDGIVSAFNLPIYPSPDAASSTQSEWQRKDLEDVSEIFLLFSQGDGEVKQHMVETDVLQGLLQVLRPSSPSLLLDDFYSWITLKLVKCIRNLSMDLNTLDQLFKAGTIAVLLGLLKIRQGPHFKEIQSHGIHAMYYLCQLNKSRQTKAAELGLIPELLTVIHDRSPMKQFAMQLLMDLAHASTSSREELRGNDCGSFFVRQLTEKYWQTIALNSLAAWLVNEPSYIEQVLLEPENLQRLVALFRTAQGEDFEQITETFQEMVVRSTALNQALGRSSLFVAEIVERVRYPKAKVRKDLLQLLKSIIEGHQHPKQLILEHNLSRTARECALDPVQVLVRAVAHNLEQIIIKIVTTPGW